VLRPAPLVQPFVALVTAASFFVATGLRAALLASAWLLTALVVLLGLPRLFERGAYPLHELSIDADIPTMALTHGLLNAFGFATCSLLAWSHQQSNLK